MMRSQFLAIALLMTLGATCAGLASARADESLFYIAPTAPKPPAATEEPKSPRQHTDQMHGRVCFGQAETRERIATYKLAEPLQALQTGSAQGDALRAKLCRWKTDEFVYEIAVLRHDGRIVHVYMNAQNGMKVSP